MRTNHGSEMPAAHRSCGCEISLNSAIEKAVQLPDRGAGRSPMRRHLETPVWTAVLAILAAVLVGGAAGSMIARTVHPVFTVAAASPADASPSFNETFAP